MRKELGKGGRKGLRWKCKRDLKRLLEEVGRTGNGEKPVTYVVFAKTT